MIDETYVKLTDLIEKINNNESSNNVTNTNTSNPAATQSNVTSIAPTYQIQPQNNLQQVKIAFIAHQGNAKNFINSFVLFDKVSVIIYELLHTQETIKNTCIPIFELQLSNGLVLFLIFQTNEEILCNTIQPQQVNGNFYFEFYNTNTSIPEKINSMPYEYVNKNLLLEDLIGYFFKFENIHYIKNI